MERKGPELPAAETGQIRSVTEFTREIKELLEDGVRPGWITGEVSNLRAQASGHVYFSLKDATAQLACVLFRGDALRQTVELRDGLQVLVFGQLSVYEARGQYQMVVRAVIDHGTGRLQLEFEKLKQQLAAEGLFESARKRALPLLPHTVGFITSASGAAVRDFIRILQRRGWTGRIVVLPAKVQGVGATTEMVEVLRQAIALKIFDVLVIGRGGGSIEDLWAFNGEALVRAIAASPVPVISAVGHEIDYTLCDFVADVRAETPSAAAELISSNYLAMAERLNQVGETMLTLTTGAIERGLAKVDHARSRLRLLRPTGAIEQNHLRVDDLNNRLESALRGSLQNRAQAMAVIVSRLSGVAPERRVQAESHRLLSLWKRLESASPASVLKRGYALVRDAKGRPVSSAHAVKSGQPLVNEFHDGRVNVKAD